MRAAWAGIEQEVHGVRRAAENVDAGRLAKYVYDRACAYVGPDHAEVTSTLFRAALDATSAPEAHEGEREAVRELRRLATRLFTLIDDANHGVVYGTDPDEMEKCRHDRACLERILHLVRERLTSLPTRESTPEKGGEDG